MSYKLDMPQVGDILTLNTQSVYAHRSGEQIGKFLVVSKDSSEANKTRDIDNTLITLYILQMDDEYLPRNNKEGSTTTIRYGQMIYSLYSWKHDYHHPGKEGVQSGELWSNVG